MMGHRNWREGCNEKGEMLVSGYKVSVRWEKQIVGFYYTAQ
jgi:hypothetical protein